MEPALTHPLSPQSCPRVTKCSGLDGTFGSCHIVPLSRQDWDRVRTGSEQVWETPGNEGSVTALFSCFSKSSLYLVLQTWPQNCPSCCHPAQGGFFSSNLGVFPFSCVYLSFISCVYLSQTIGSHYTHAHRYFHVGTLPLSVPSLFYGAVYSKTRNQFHPSSLFYTRDMSWPYTGTNLDFH